MTLPTEVAAARMLFRGAEDAPYMDVALRRSMLAMMADEANPHFAHPAFWAPFVVVGEGGVYRQGR